MTEYEGMEGGGAGEEDEGMKQLGIRIHREK